MICIKPTNEEINENNEAKQINDWNCIEYIEKQYKLALKENSLSLLSALMCAILAIFCIVGIISLTKEKVSGKSESGPFGIAFIVILALLLLGCGYVISLSFSKKLIKKKKKYKWRALEIEREAKILKEREQYRKGYYYENSDILITREAVYGKSNNVLLITNEIGTVDSRIVKPTAALSNTANAVTSVAFGLLGNAAVKGIKNKLNEMHECIVTKKNKADVTIPVYISKKSDSTKEVMTALNIFRTM